MLLPIWFTSILCVLLVFLSAFCMHCVYRLLFQSDDFYKIQGPKGLFIFGNSLDFFKNRVEIFQYFQEQAKKYKDMFKLNVLSFKLLLLYSPEDVETLLSGNNYPKKGRAYKLLKPWLKDGLLISIGEKWQHRRKIITPAFHFNILRFYYSTILKKCDDLVEFLEPEVGKTRTEILPLLADFTLDTICETAMGSSVGHSTSFGRKYRHAILELGMFMYERAIRVLYHSDFIYQFSNMARRQKEYVNTVAAFRNRVLENRRQNRRDIDVDSEIANDDDTTPGRKKLDLLDILLKAEDENKIDKDGICEEVDTFTFEGHDTASAALQYFFMLLANHPEIQDQVFEEICRVCGPAERALELRDLADMKYLECCIKEALRLYPSAFFITRRVETPFHLKNGMTVNNAEIVVSLFEMHRREDQFPEPLRFLPERFMGAPTWHRYAYLPFSAGPRNCIGQKFAMMEMKVATASVLRKYRLRPVTKPEDIEFIIDMLLRPKHPICVKVEKR